MRHSRRDIDEIAGLDAIEMLEIRAVAHFRSSFEHIDGGLVGGVIVWLGLRAGRQDHEMHAEALGARRLGRDAGKIVEPLLAMKMVARANDLAVFHADILAEPSLRSIATRSEMPPVVNVRYMVDNVDAAVQFYTTHLGFTPLTNAAPAFADVARGELRLLLSGRTSSAGRPMPDGSRPVPGGWNRIQLIVDDLDGEVERLKAEGVKFRNEIVKGPGGLQILLEDPSGNVVELFQPAERSLA